MMVLLHRNVRQSRAPSTPRSIITTPRPFKSGRIAFAQTDEFKHTREVHVWLLAQASMNGSGKRGKILKRHSGESADARTFAIESPRAAASPAASGTASNLLSSARPSPKSLTRAPRSTHRSRRIAAATQSALARARHRRRRGRCRAFEFAERQFLDVHGSGVLDACKQRLQLLSGRADVSLNRAHTKPAAPLRHLARSAPACWPIMSSARGDLGNVSQQ
jgi:hypothetical protein